MLTQLADLIRTRNAIDAKIAAVIGRPASMGNIGEFIAAGVFDIILEDASNAKHIDGRFSQGPLMGQTVNIKWYAKMDSELDVHATGGPDYYLVLAGPKGNASSSRGQVRPMLIESVFLFDAARLVEALRARSVQIGTGTSVIKALWEDAEVFPTPRNRQLVLTDEQRAAFTLFGAAQQAAAVVQEVHR